MSNVDLFLNNLVSLHKENINKVPYNKYKEEFILTDKQIEIINSCKYIYDDKIKKVISLISDIPYSLFLEKKQGNNISKQINSVFVKLILYLLN